jgi:Na+/melibiose symporter-like transporter
MKKLNKRKMFIFGIIISIVGTVALGLFGNSKTSVVTILLFLNVGSGFYNGVLYGIIADVVRYTKSTTGKLIAGAGNACVSAAVKLGQAAATILLGFGLSFAGFNAALDSQPESVVPVIKTMYS